MLPMRCVSASASRVTIGSSPRVRVIAGLLNFIPTVGLTLCRVLHVSIARSVTRLGGCRPRTIRPHGGGLLQTHECSSATRGTRPEPAPREGRAPCEPERPWGFPHHV